MLQHEKEKNDFHFIVLAWTNDLIAAEAQYHSSCYTEYTRSVTGKKVIEKSGYQKLELQAFQEVIKHCYDIICSSSILKFKKLLWKIISILEKEYEGEYYFCLQL